MKTPLVTSGKTFIQYNTIGLPWLHHGVRYLLVKLYYKLNIVLAFYAGYLLCFTYSGSMSTFLSQHNLSLVCWLMSSYTGALCVSKNYMVRSYLHEPQPHPARHYGNFIIIKQYVGSKFVFLL